VSVAAKYRFGYCQTQQEVVGTPMEIDHLIPESRGGPTEADNLWLACTLCNDHRGSRIAAPDPASGEVVRLFDPRHQTWSEHFRWNDAGTIIVGLTSTGRATVAALQLNRNVRLGARRRWVRAGWHPPSD
jgi:hypothetical protein